MNHSLKRRISEAKRTRSIAVSWGIALLFLLCCMAYFVKFPVLMPSGAQLPVVFYNSPRTKMDEQKGIYVHVFLPKEDGTAIDESSESLSGKSIRFVFSAKSDGLQEIDFFTTGQRHGRPVKILASIYKCDEQKSCPEDKASMRLIHSGFVSAPTSSGLQRHVFSFPRQNSSYGDRFVVEISSPDKTSAKICIKKTSDKNPEYYVNDRAIAGNVYFWDGYGRTRFSMRNRPVLLGSQEFIVQHAFLHFAPWEGMFQRVPVIISKNLSRILFVFLLMGSSVAAPYFIWQFVIWQTTVSKRTSDDSGHTKDLLTFLGMAIFLGPFLYIVYWFSAHDIWNTNITYRNSIYAFHTIFRAVFIFYFSWIIYGAGSLLVRLMEKLGGKLALSYLDRVIVVFFVGAAGLQIVMFALGYMNGYYRFTALLLSIPILLLSYADLCTFAKEGAIRIADVMKKSDHHDKTIYYLLGSAVIFISAILFLVIGLYTRDGDYITHYGNFYDEVMRHHGIWPNGWWYQYFYSKGAGLFFLSMLLTDKMSPPIVSYIFIMASCLVMISLIKRISKEFIGPITAIVYYLGALIVNDPIPYRMHVVSGVMLIALAWMLAIANHDHTKISQVWRMAGSLLFGSLVILAPTISIYAFATLGIYLAGALMKRRWNLAQLCAVWIIVGGAFLVTILGINFLTTGLFEGTPFRLWLSLWDQVRSSAWVSPYMLFYVSELIGPDMGRVIMPGQVSCNVGMGQLLGNVLRINYITPLFLKWLLFPGVTILTFMAIRKKADLSTYAKVVLLPALVILALVILSLLSINQTTSLMRSVGFSGFYMVLCVFSLWYLALQHYDRKAFNIFVLWVVLVAFSLTLKPIVSLKHRIDYISGKKSMWDAMAAEGNIYKPIADMRKEIGIDKQVAYLQINGNLGQAYLIGRGLLNPISYSYRDKWHILAFEEPEKAIAAFKEMGINYFLIDFSARAYDLIAYSSLFNGTNMKKYLSMRWSSDPFYLLTWHSDHGGSSDISDDFLRRWTKEQKRPDHFGFRAYQRLKLIYQYNNGRIFGVKVPSGLPPLEKSIEKGLLIYKKGD